METVKVKKSELLEHLKENRDTHDKDYKDAMCGYRILVEKELKKRLKQVKSGEKFNLQFNNLFEPKSFVKDYDDVIGMLSISMDEDIEITLDQYLKYYKNEWDWKTAWDSTYSGYATFYNSPAVGGVKRG